MGLSCLESIREIPLPEGYRYVFYKNGDRDDWIEIERTAGEVCDHAHGVRTWEKYFGDYEHLLPERMIFIENEEGEKVATATAFFDNFGNDKSGAGWVHWVAVRADHQGRRLSRPLISKTLATLGLLGYSHAILHTQTTSWVACRIYLDFGFLPLPESEIESKEGWQILKTITNHPSLEKFESINEQDIFRENTAK